jgi:hypothetical protein
MLWQRLQREMPATLAETIKIADMYALGDPTQPLLMSAESSKRYPVNDGAGMARRHDRQDYRHKRKDDGPEYRYGTNQVAAVEQERANAGITQRQKTNGPQWGQKYDGQRQGSDQKKPWQDRPKYTYEMMLDQPCSFHTPHPGKPANHTTRQCTWFQRVGKAEGNPLPPPPPLTGANTQSVKAPSKYIGSREKREAVNQVGNQANNNAAHDGRNDYKEHHQSYVVFVTEPIDKQSRHRRAMEVNAVMPAVPKFMYWSEQEISWSRDDHPKVMPSPGGYALVVDPTFIGPDINVKFSKVLIDHGSSINILYRDTMLKLGIKENMLQPSRTTFHGIVPGVSCAPMGKIWVEVLFGTRENCRVENVLFEVVDLDSPYHALLGRPALAKFMAATHTAYLKMKMPGPKGIITISGNYKRSMECASAGSALAESLVIAEEKKRIHEAVALAQSAQLGMPGMSNPLGTVAFQAAKETKKVLIDEAIPDQTVIIGAGLTDK